MTKQKCVLLIILDGWGINHDPKFNAISMATTPNWNWLIKNSTNTKLNASGLEVGLPYGQIGNSEVGHSTIGAGRIIEQDLIRINNVINNSELYNNKILSENLALTLKQGKKIHILGLLSDGGVHSHIDHLIGLLKTINQNKTINHSSVLIHAFTDGRDTPPKSAIKYLEKLNKVNANVVSICGRYFAMDRDNRSDRTKKAYDLLTSGIAEFNYQSAIEAITESYNQDHTDEFIPPIKIHGFSPIADGDLVICYNYRSDRMRQLCYALTKKQFAGSRKLNNPKIKLLTFTKYAEDLDATVIFAEPKITNTLSECVAKYNFSQLKIAETEKYPHVTFFFNGKQDICFPLEDRILLPSPKIATYDLQPEMSALEITDKLIENISFNKYKLIVCNFANADMVGHTGNLEATIKAIETIDHCLGKILQFINKYYKNNLDLIITADHGNAELMYDFKNQQNLTAHTNFPVPFIYLGENIKKLNNSISNYSLKDLAPTVLDLLGIPKPKEMQGTNLLVS